MGGAVEGDVGQLLWIGFHGTAAPADVRERIAAGHVGACVLFARNIVRDGDGAADVAALIELIRDLHEASPDPDRRPLVAIDQEGGRVQRVKVPGTVWPPMMSFDALGDTAEANRLAYSVGYAVGVELAALGIDVDFAPVLDVHTNPDNPIIGDRAFGTDPQVAADRGLAFARGLARSGVLGCGKHFPGHGDTATDSHLELPRVDADMARLRRVELVPFARAARDRLPMLMTAHVVMPALDPERPATLSRAVITDLLRGELGYQGVVVSDDLDMKAISVHYGAGDAAVAAVEAGCDALLLCEDQAAQTAAFEALMARATEDEVFRVRVAAAAERVRALKRKRETSTVARAPSAAGALAVLGCDSHQRLARELRGQGRD